MPIACCCQTGKWTFSLDYGLQAHDKRLFDFPPKESVLERQPEAFGTHQFGIRLEKEVAQKGKLLLNVGAGLSTELSTFDRPFDYTYKKDDITKVLRWTNRYYQFLMQSSINGTYKLNGHFGLSLGVLSQLNFLTIANHTTSDESYSWWRFNLYSVEFNPGIEYTKSRMAFSLRYRAFQVKKIDRILFNDILDDPRREQTFETFNPFKMWLSIGYMF